jgi:hypothetical protein
VDVAEARDASVAEHGEHVRAIWDDVIGRYVAACNDVVARVCTDR